MATKEVTTLAEYEITGNGHPKPTTEFIGYRNPGARIPKRRATIGKVNLSLAGITAAEATAAAHAQTITRNR